ncbi:MAG: phage baseplate protein [Bacteroidales bacterium]|nr:phage baseplate protein [Candidatus Scybalousia scybalohippi]
MNVRQLWLINSKGDKYDLNSKQHFLYDPNGLGFQKGYSNQRIGNSERITDEFFQMVDVNGEMLFIGANNEFNYQYYDEFIDFIKFKPLQLHYKTPNKVYGYYSDVVITSIQKGETSVDGILHCPIVFHRSTQWKNDETTKLVFTNQIETGGKFYDYTYDYHYAGNSLSDMQPIVNNGTEDCPMVFEIVCNDGDTVVNPLFTLFQNDVPYAKIKLTGTFSYVRINSDELNESIYLEDEDGTPIANPMNTQDFASFDGETYFTFIKLKTGENTGVFTCGNIDTFDGVIKLSYEEKRASV